MTTDEQRDRLSELADRMVVILAEYGLDPNRISVNHVNEHGYGIISQRVTGFGSTEPVVSIEKWPWGFPIQEFLEIRAEYREVYLEAWGEEIIEYADDDSGD